MITHGVQPLSKIKPSKINTFSINLEGRDGEGNERERQKGGDKIKRSSVISAKKQRRTIEWERLEISSRKLEIARD